MSFRAFDSISTVVAVMAAVVILLYKRRQAALTSGNDIPFPPGPPARWFWDNVLPAAK
jgi:hypothetical protein